MNSLDAFFAMGGYAAYVWPAYGLAALVMLALVFATLRRLRRSERELKALQDAGLGRRARSGNPKP